MTATFRIMLDAGHGLPTPSRRTLNKGMQEWTLNDIVARQVAKNLEGYNCEIRRSDDTTGRTDVPLATRQQRINSFNPHAFVSIHHNAFQGVWGDHGGVETFIRNSPSANSRRFADIVQANMVRNIGLRNRGVKNTNWAVLMVNTAIPAILTESGFMDSRTDVPVIESAEGQQKYARAISDGLIEFLGLQVSKPTPAPTEPSKPTPPSKPSTGNSNNNSIVDWMNANGMDSSFANRARLAQQHGIANFTGTAAQNTQLLNILRGQGSSSGSTPSQPVQPPKPTQSFFPATQAGGTSIVDALRAINVDTSFSNRQRIAAANGIKNFSGTPAQNAQMLNLLRQGRLVRS